MNEFMKYIAGGAVALVMILLCFVILYCVFMMLPYIFMICLVCFFLAYAKRRGAEREERRKQRQAVKDAAKGL